MASVANGHNSALEHYTSTHNQAKTMNIIKTTGKLRLLVCAFFALAANVEAQSSLTEGLLAYYPFSGNADDATGNGHNGVVTDAVLTTNRFGQANSAYAFDGTNSMIVVSNSADLQPLQDFSVSVWAVVVKTPVPPYQSPLLSKGSSSFVSGDREWSLEIEPFNNGTAPPLPTNGWWLTFQAPYLNTPRVSIPTNTWFQAVFTFQGTSWNNQNQVSTGTWHFYFNGLLANSGIDSISENNDPDPFVMGASRGFNSAGYPYHFDGLLDDIRIYDRALSSNEVQQLYTEEAGPPLQPQVDTHKAIQLEFSQLTIGVQYQLQFSHNKRRWMDAGAAFTATATNQTEFMTTGDLDLHDVDWRLRLAP
jgi:hypothetical protein